MRLPFLAVVVTGMRKRKYVAISTGGTAMVPSDAARDAIPSSKVRKCQGLWFREPLGAQQQTIVLSCRPFTNCVIIQRADLHARPARPAEAKETERQRYRHKITDRGSG